jgi:signal transduction histidine kinase
VGHALQTGTSTDLRALSNLARAASAGEADLETLVPRLCASLAESFGLGRVELVLPGDETAAEAVARDSGQVSCVAGRLVVPLVAADSIVGLLVSDCDDEPAQEVFDLLGVAGAFVAVLVQRSLAVEELERLSKLKSQFIALASHELRAPAAVIHGVAKTFVAHADRLDATQIGTLHESLARNTDRLARLIDELLDLSRLDAKAIPIERAPLAVRSRVHEIVHTVAGDRSGEVVIEVPDDLRPLVDPVAFERIVGNLVSNALRYGRAPVSVRAAQSDRHFRLSVEDRGDGVAPGFVPKLFDRFSREHDRDERGSGLGLSIAQAYAQAHGGQVFYEDVSPHGARFQLVLPSSP